MEFITLQAVLDGIVATIPPRSYVSEAIADKFKDDEWMLACRQYWELTAPDIYAARRLSEAAQKLNKALHHHAKPPQWVQYDKVKGFAVPAASIGGEGVDLLTHATGWGKREQKLHTEHIADCERNGLHPAWNDPARNMNDGQAPASSFFRLREIGFDRAELILFLDANGIAHDLGSEGKHLEVGAGESPAKTVVEAPDPERRLAALYAMGGTAKWKRRKGVQQWVFTGIQRLVIKEKSDGRKRSDEKTIRLDLTQAAEAESMAKRNGATWNL